MSGAPGASRNPGQLPISPSRAVAFEALQSVAKGSYASDELLKRSQGLASRDAGLAAQIVFGSLRYQGQLDYLIGKYSGRDASALDLAVVTALRAAIFQLRYLERVPPHAAVHESVEFVKAHKRAASGFANAVLRKVDRRPMPWPDQATELSCPEWLLERWISQFGLKQARAIALAALSEPESYMRIPPGSPPPEGVSIAPTPVAGCFRLLSSNTGKTATESSVPPEGQPSSSLDRRHPSAPFALSAGPTGLRFQDIGSQAIVPLLDLQPGQSYLDLCAAPGNKTMQALETPLALAVACDLSPKRIREIPPVCHRVVLDATRRLPFSRRFDRIFIDAPCSGTGTLARNPEIKWRIQSQDFEQFQKKQAAMVLQALPLLAPGGKLLYATCSLESEENQGVLAKVLAGVPEFRCVCEAQRLPGREEGDGFYAALLQLA